MSKKTINYEEAYEELKTIVEGLEDGEISVDELSLKVKRATELIRLCKKKLTATEDDVKTILEELENE